MNNEAQIFDATTAKIQTLSDDVVRVYVDIDPSQAPEALQAFCRNGTPVAIARLDNKAALKAEQKKLIDADKPVMQTFGEHAKSLKLHGFCRSPKVQAILGVYFDPLGSESLEFCEELTWKRMREHFGCQSMKYVNPKEVLLWAEKNDVKYLLPKIYKE